MPRRAVVLMNLGGPSSPASVRPFLYNLFSDPAISGLPTALRLPLARLIASRRAKIASNIYAQLGGASPLLANTEAQARALEAALDVEHRCFIAMRYWHPLTSDTVSDVRAWDPDEIILLPLYPQFSTTTTRSSLDAWGKEAVRQGLACPTWAIESYPIAGGFIAALAELIGTELRTAEAESAPARLLMSAHGLPLKTVRRGDPYPEQIQSTAAAVAQSLARPDLDWRVCYQSRVGPLAWLGPSVEEELDRAGRDGVGVVVAPISFVSEHSETLVELDRDYRRMAGEHHVPFYRRVPTVGTHALFIDALADLVRRAAASEERAHAPQPESAVR
jgi:protoporphyrin/coproporphyrin ferrochelatase